METTDEKANTSLQKTALTWLWIGIVGILIYREVKSSVLSSRPDHNNDTTRYDRHRLVDSFLIPSLD